MTALAAGPQHVLAVGSEGQVFSWGQGSHGRLGLGTDDNQYVIKLLSFWYCYIINYKQFYVEVC